MQVKERLLFLCREAFAGSMDVLLRARCPACRRETPLRVAALADAVAAECAVGGIRADVLLSRGGAPALALEVRVTHEVDARKEAALASLALPAFEIDAREMWEEEVPGGVAVGIARTLGASPCASCRIVARADVARALGGEEALVAELEAYRARGLFGPRPGDPLASCPPLSSGERGRIAASFRCPECRTTTLSLGARLVRHACCACVGAPDRPVAWRGYDGALVELSWWRRS